MSYGREYLEFGELLAASGNGVVARDLFVEYVRAHSQAIGYGQTRDALIFFYGDKVYRLVNDASVALRLSYAGSAAARLLEAAFNLKAASAPDGWATVADSAGSADERRLFTFLKMLSRDSKPRVDESDNYDFAGVTKLLMNGKKPTVRMSANLARKSFFDILCGVRDRRIAVNEVSFSLTER